MLLGAGASAEAGIPVSAAMIVSDCDECGFNDLGKLLFGGLILAVLIGVGASLFWRRAKEKNGASSFVSIKSNERDP